MHGTRAGLHCGAMAPLEAGHAEGCPLVGWGGGEALSAARGPGKRHGVPETVGSRWGAVGASASPPGDRPPPRRAHSPLSRRPVAPRGPASSPASSTARSAAPSGMARLWGALGHRGAPAAACTAAAAAAASPEDRRARHPEEAGRARSQPAATPTPRPRPLGRHRGEGSPAG